MTALRTIFINPIPISLEVCLKKCSSTCASAANKSLLHQAGNRCKTDRRFCVEWPPRSAFLHPIRWTTWSRRLAAGLSLPPRNSSRNGIHDLGPVCFPHSTVWSACRHTLDRRLARISHGWWLRVSPSPASYAPSIRTWIHRLRSMYSSRQSRSESVDPCALYRRPIRGRLHRWPSLGWCSNRRPTEAKSTFGRLLCRSRKCSRPEGWMMAIDRKPSGCHICWRCTQGSSEEWRQCDLCKVRCADKPIII